MRPIIVWVHFLHQVPLLGEFSVFIIMEFASVELFSLEDKIILDKTLAMLR